MVRVRLRFRVLPSRHFELDAFAFDLSVNTFSDLDRSGLSKSNYYWDTTYRQGKRIEHCVTTNQDGWNNKALTTFRCQLIDPWWLLTLVQGTMQITHQPRIL
jgi:hypothetical protein